jgi:hypothetical protein
MKRSFMSSFIMIWGISSCSHPTTPPLNSHPFPHTFKQLTISYKNIPERWSYENYSWHYDQQSGGRVYDYDNSGSGTSLFSGEWSSGFSYNSFIQKDDTIEASGLTIVIDSIAGQIENLIFSGGSSNSSYGGSGYGINCQNMTYQEDTANKTYCSLTGLALKQNLLKLDTGWQMGADMELQGQRSTGSRAYFDSIVDNSSITIQITP